MAEGSFVCFNSRGRPSLLSSNSGSNALAPPSPSSSAEKVSDRITTCGARGGGWEGEDLERSLQLLKRGLGFDWKTT